MTKYAGIIIYVGLFYENDNCRKNNPDILEFKPNYSNMV